MNSGGYSTSENVVPGLIPHGTEKENKLGDYLRIDSSIVFIVFYVSFLKDWEALKIFQKILSCHEQASGYGTALKRISAAPLCPNFHGVSDPFELIFMEHHHTPRNLIDFTEAYSAKSDTPLSTFPEVITALLINFRGVSDLLNQFLQGIRSL